jgi:glycosyltransferase involved in cell wall biosynthesis
VKRTKRPKVSVMMGTYNTSKYIGECIESVLNQTFQDFEFIIINDKSTDDTLEVIKRYNDKRIIVINNNKNLGVAESLNKGLRKAKGKYIAIMDSDDVMMPERLQITYDYLEKNKEVFLVGGALYYMEDNGKLMLKDIPLIGYEKIRERLKERSCFWHNTIMFRNDKKTFYRGKFRYAQDYDLFTRLNTRGKRMENMPDVLAKYRIHNSSSSYSRRTKQNMFADKVREFYKQRLTTGKDKYAAFDPKTIMNRDISNTKNKKILFDESKTHWMTKEYKKSREYAWKYIVNYGPFTKLTIYYLGSYLPEFIIKSYRSIKKSLKGENG